MNGFNVVRITFNTVKGFNVAVNEHAYKEFRYVVQQNCHVLANLKFRLIVAKCLVYLVLYSEN